MVSSFAWRVRTARVARSWGCCGWTIFHCPKNDHAPNNGFLFMTMANKIAYVLVYFVVIFTALAYGTVHQPVIALFYVLVAAITVLWAVDGLANGSVRFSPSLLQLP